MTLKYVPMIQEQTIFTLKLAVKRILFAGKESLLQIPSHQSSPS